MKSCFYKFKGMINEDFAFGCDYYSLEFLQYC